MFGDGDYMMITDFERSLKKLLESFTWKRAAILIASKLLSYLLPLFGYMITAVDVVFKLVQVCYPIYLRKAASNHITQLEKNLRGFELEWEDVMQSLIAIHDSMAIYNENNNQ